MQPEVVTQTEPIGLSLRIARLKAGLRQYQVATEAGLSEPQLSLIETGRRKPTDEQVQRIRAAIEKVAA